MRALQGIGECARFINHDRGARVLCEVRRVAGELGDQERRGARSVGRNRNERGVRLVAARVEARQRALEGATHERTRGRRNLGFCGQLWRLIYLRHNDICCTTVKTGGDARPNAAIIEGSPKP